MTIKSERDRLNWEFREAKGAVAVAASADVAEKRLSHLRAFVDKRAAMQSQEGGDHYTKLKIQPMEYSMANGLDACQHTVIKYVTRFRDKGGIEDLRKAIHTIEMLIELEALK